MTKGKLTPLALAIGFALCGTAFAGQNWNAFIDDNRTFDKTETITSDKATVVGTGVGVGSYPITPADCSRCRTYFDQYQYWKFTRSGGVVGGKRYNVYWRETHSSSR